MDRDEEADVLLKSAGEAFGRERVLTGKSQQEIAELAGIQQASLSRFECGRNNVTLRTMARVARALDKRVEIRLVDR